MVNPAHSTSQPQNFAPNQTVQTDAQEGEWMLLPKASEITGLHEKTLRRYIKKKVLKSRRLGKQTNSPLQVWITAEVISTVEAETDFVDSASDTFDDDDVDPPSNEGHTDSPVAEVVRIIAQQFADKLDQQTQVIYQMRTELIEKDRQLRLLPDLQKKIDEQNKLAEFEKIALQKQLEQLQTEGEAHASKLLELEQENERLKQEAEAAAKSKKGFWNWFLGKP